MTGYNTNIQIRSTDKLNVKLIQELENEPSYQKFDAKGYKQLKYREIQIANIAFKTFEQGRIRPQDAQTFIKNNYHVLRTLLQHGVEDYRI